MGDGLLGGLGGGGGVGGAGRGGVFFFFFFFHFAHALVHLLINRDPWGVVYRNIFLVTLLALMTTSQIFVKIVSTRVTKVC